MAKLTSIAATRLRGAVAMLRARPINDVLARAERILLLCVFRGFGSRRIAVVCKRDVCALHEAACCSLWQRAVALQRVRQRATAGSDRCDACAIPECAECVSCRALAKKQRAKAGMG